MSKFFIGELVEVVSPEYDFDTDSLCHTGDTGVIEGITTDDNGNTIYQVCFQIWNVFEQEEVVIEMLENEINYTLGIKMSPPPYKATDLIKIINVDDPYLSVENEIKIGATGYIEDVYKDIVGGVPQYVYSCFVRSAANEPLSLVDLYEHEFELDI